MNLLTAPVRRIYFHYLFPSLGSALVITIYSLVDTIAVGQYEGPVGAAAMAVIGPVWAMMISFGLLFGIGGAAKMSTQRGAGRDGSRYVTIGMVSAFVFAMLLWLVFNLTVREMLIFFGADEIVLPVAMRYIFWIRLSLPLFTMASVLAAYIRNDGNPGLCMAAVVTGGLFNVFGDWFFVFPMDMGISGAGLATALGQTIQVVILLSHFFSKRNTLRFGKPDRFLKGLFEILGLGAAPFFIDLTNGLLICFFNIQIVRYLVSNDYLSVYGVVCTLAALAQALFNGVGQTIQPMISVNFGAGNWERIRETRGLALWTAGGMGVLIMLTGLLFPEALISIFMSATENVLLVGAPIFRVYFLCFMPMGINILLSYYFQSICQMKEGMTIALLRGILLSSVLLLLLPLLFSGEAIWWTTPITEWATLAVAIVLLLHSGKKGEKGSDAKF